MVNSSYLACGVIAMADGFMPTMISLAAVLVAVLIGMTLPWGAPEAAAKFSTYAVLPSLVITIASGMSPTRIGFPVWLVAVRIGMTLLAKPTPTLAT